MSEAERVKRRAALLIATLAGWSTMAAPLPELVTRESAASVELGLSWLAQNQAEDGSWRLPSQYPVTVSSLAGLAILASGSTPNRGPYASHLSRLVDYLIPRVGSDGLISDAGEESGRPMYGHGFALTFLASVYGMETDPRSRERIADGIRRAIRLTSTGQSGTGGWTYRPGDGDEGSVTITQLQALRATHNAGFYVPGGTISSAVRYIEQCSATGGGIRYSLSSGGTPQPAISAAAAAALYNAGEFDSPIAHNCLVYLRDQTEARPWAKFQGGHAWYFNFYACQAYYLGSDKDWQDYFPKVRQTLVASQATDGSWSGEIGPAFTTSIALIILQTPYKYLPILQR
jgi:hypothetical protein